MPRKLSATRKSILSYISQFRSENGYPPTVREIGEAVGLASSSNIHRHLKCLERDGYIRRREPKSPRALEVVDTIEKKNTVTFFANTHNPVLYLVQDDAMMKSRIEKGDMVIVCPGHVEDGRIALVSINGHKMVRRLYSDGNQWMLEADSKDEGPIVTSEIEVIGKVIGVINWFEGV